LLTTTLPSASAVEAMAASVVWYPFGRTRHAPRRAPC
jgi:hypothetical protein